MVDESAGDARDALKKNVLGVSSIFFYVIAAASPFTHALTLQSLFGNAAPPDAPAATPAASWQAQLAHSALAGHLPLWRTLWEGDVAVPHDDARYRLVVAEYEEYVVDDSRPYDRTPTRKGRRLARRAGCRPRWRP